MALNPLLVVLLPLAYILVACFISMQFSVVLHFIGQAGIHIKRVPQLAPAEPGEGMSEIAVAAGPHTWPTMIMMLVRMRMLGQCRM